MFIPKVLVSSGCQINDEELSCVHAKKVASRLKKVQYIAHTSVAPGIIVEVAIERCKSFKLRHPLSMMGQSDSSKCRKLVALLALDRHVDALAHFSSSCARPLQATRELYNAQSPQV
ncbi:hypothetical protein C8R46DRAFT_1185628 [Mycena filopes]|nr:hypothetical protein C8R46DRAFT_1185628 [Mycena filopes]